MAVVVCHLWSMVGVIKGSDSSGDGHGVGSGDGHGVGSGEGHGGHCRICTVVYYLRIKFSRAKK